MAVWGRGGEPSQVRGSRGPKGGLDQVPEQHHAPRSPRVFLACWRVCVLRVWGCCWGVVFFVSSLLNGLFFIGAQAEGFQESVVDCAFWFPLCSPLLFFCTVFWFLVCWSCLVSASCGLRFPCQHNTLPSSSLAPFLPYCLGFVQNRSLGNWEYVEVCMVQICARETGAAF